MTLILSNKKEKKSSLLSNYINRFAADQMKITQDKLRKFRNILMDDIYNELSKPKNAEPNKMPVVDVNTLEKKMYLEALEIDNSNWPSINNISTKIDDMNPIPDTILQGTHYYEKLSEIADAFDHGDIQKANDIIEDRATIESKNKQIIPIFNRIKGAIKSHTNTEEYKLFQKYSSEKAQKILQGFPNTNEHIKELSDSYKLRFANIRAQLKNNPTEYITKEMEYVVDVLYEWANYIMVINYDSYKFSMEALPPSSEWEKEAIQESYKRQFDVDKYILFEKTIKEAKPLKQNEVTNLFQSMKISPLEDKDKSLNKLTGSHIQNYIKSIEIKIDWEEKAKAIGITKKAKPAASHAKSNIYLSLIHI